MEAAADMEVVDTVVAVEDMHQEDTQPSKHTLPLLAPCQVVIVKVSRKQEKSMRKSWKRRMDLTSLSLYTCMVSFGMGTQMSL